MASSDNAAVLGRYRNTCVIGAGVIGASWTALFLAHGLNVVVNDPQPDIENIVRTMLAKAAPTLKALGLPHEGLDKNLRFEPDLDRAVAGVDLIQENGPENPDWKQKLWERVEPSLPKHALLLSSSSARPASEQGKLMKGRESAAGRPSLQSAASDSAGRGRSRRTHFHRGDRRRGGIL